MKVQFDQKADAIYFRLDESTTIESEEVRSGVILDFNDRDQVESVTDFIFSINFDRLYCKR